VKYEDISKICSNSSIKGVRLFCSTLMKLNLTNLTCSIVFLITKRIGSKFVTVIMTETRVDMRDIRNFSKILNFIETLWTKLDENDMDLYCI
jgi:hypothetical protein